MKRILIPLLLSFVAIASFAAGPSVSPANGVAVFDANNKMVGQFITPGIVSMRLDTGEIVYLSMAIGAVGELKWYGESLYYDLVGCGGNAYAAFGLTPPGLLGATVTYSNELWIATATRPTNVALMSMRANFDGACVPTAGNTGPNGYPVMTNYLDLDNYFTLPSRVGAGNAPAVATFTDVPTGHPFYKFVELMAASGITAGCGGGKFCPDAAVTRGQMAVFMAQALGLRYLP